MANGITTRRSVASVETDAALLSALRNAYRSMQALTDNRGWAYWAGLHGFPQWFCWHHGRARGQMAQPPYNLFLPWHRAYLLYWENAMRDQDPAAALPWWDWTSSSSHLIGIPRTFTEPLADGSPNPLYAGPVPEIQGDPAHASTRDPGDPADLPTRAQYDAVLALENFLDFQEQLENIHDGIHGWTGGDMGVVSTAAYDPVFWSHHCMIDRAWAIWQDTFGVMSIPSDYLDRTLEPFALRVRDVLDITQLGYEYVVSRSSVVMIPNDV